MMSFFCIHISQDSVATRLGCGGVFVHDFVTNFLLSLKVKEFWKSANIWYSYGQEFGVLFFLTHGVLALPAWGSGKPDTTTLHFLRVMSRSVQCTTDRMSTLPELPSCLVDIVAEPRVTAAVVSTKSFAAHCVSSTPLFWLSLVWLRLRLWTSTFSCATDSESSDRLTGTSA